MFTILIVQIHTLLFIFSHLYYYHYTSFWSNFFYPYSRGFRKSFVHNFGFRIKQKPEHNILLFLVELLLFFFNWKGALTGVGRLLNIFLTGCRNSLSHPSTHFDLGIILVIINYNIFLIMCVFAVLPLTNIKKISA